MGDFTGLRTAASIRDAAGLNGTATCALEERDTPAGRAIEEARRATALSSSLEESGLNGAAARAMREIGMASASASLRADKGLSTGAYDKALRDTSATLVSHERASSLQSLASHLNDLPGMKGGTFAKLSDNFAKYEAASNLRDKLAANPFSDMSRLKSDILLDPISRASEIPALPPIPPNPTLETNKLLGRLVTTMTDQEAVVEATAEAQKRETELLGSLIETIAASAVSAEKAERRGLILAIVSIVMVFLAIGNDWLLEVLF